MDIRYVIRVGDHKVMHGDESVQGCLMRPRSGLGGRGGLVSRLMGMTVCRGA